MQAIFPDVNHLSAPPGRGQPEPARPAPSPRQAADPKTRRPGRDIPPAANTPKLAWNPSTTSEFTANSRHHPTNRAQPAACSPHVPRSHTAKRLQHYANQRQIHTCAPPPTHQNTLQTPRQPHANPAKTPRKPHENPTSTPRNAPKNQLPPRETQPKPNFHPAKHTQDPAPTPRKPRAIRAQTARNPRKNPLSSHNNPKKFRLPQPPKTRPKNQHFVHRQNVARPPPTSPNNAYAPIPATTVQTPNTPHSPNRPGGKTWGVGRRSEVVGRGSEVGGTARPHLRERPGTSKIPRLASGPICLAADRSSLVVGS